MTKDPSKKRTEPLPATLSLTGIGAVALLLTVLVRFRRIALALLCIGWGYWACTRFYAEQPLHLYLSWPWNTTPAWWMLLHGGWAGFPAEVLIQGGLFLWTTGLLLFDGWRIAGKLAPEEDTLGRITWGTGIAAGGLMLGVFLLGIAGGLHKGAFVAIQAVATVEALVACWRLKPRPKWTMCLSHGEKILIVCMLLLQGLSLLYALTPSVQSDALRYHLAAPQEWLKAGRILYLPYNAHSNFPFAVEMLFLYGLGLGGDLLAKGFHFLFLPLSTLAVGLLARQIVRSHQTEEKRLAGVRPAFLAAAFWGASPLALEIAGWAFIDLAVLFFTLAMLYFLGQWARYASNRYLVLAGLCGGLLCAGKYTGVAFVLMAAAAIAVITAFRDLPTNRGQSIQAPSPWRAVSLALLFGLVALAITAPWYIKNLFYTGNPFYPLAWGIFGGGEWSADLMEWYAAKSSEKGLAAITPDGDTRQYFLNLIRLPWLTVTQPEVFGGFSIGPFFYVFAPWIPLSFTIAFLRKHKDLFRLYAFLCLCAVLFWIVTYQSNRFLITFIVPAIALVAWQMESLTRKAKWMQRLTLTLATLTILYSGIDSARWLLFDVGAFQARRAPDSRRIERKSGALWPAYTLGFLSRQDYLARKIPHYRLVQFANRNLGPQNRVFLLGEHRKMHWKIPVAGSDWFDTPMILPYLHKANSSDAVLDALCEAGFTHLFVNLEEWVSPAPAWTSLTQAPRQPGSAWYYNQRHFTHHDLEILDAILASPRLEKLAETRKNRVFLAAISPTQAPHSQTSDDTAPKPQ